ncbi:hypothetical protein [Pontibacter oryzae]|uniref:hypothetical protein n=1 Tax=Pontibacter oryzae TaxID=2304593 RepID=UPI00131530EE|nr:hypothetical protein [Pontibacter oryzae]
MKKMQKTQFVSQVLEHSSYTQFTKVGVAFFAALAWSQSLSDFFREELSINIKVV